MIKVLIIDDEQHGINVLMNHLERYEDYTICGTAKTVKTAVELTHVFEPNLVFLDIALKNETGFDYLNVFLPNIDFNVVFTTAHDSYAVKAFEYSALHYLLKPIDSNKFQNALSRMDEQISQQEQLERLQSLGHNIEQPNTCKLIHISTTERNYKISTKDILFIKADSNYSHFHLTDGTKITVSKTLKSYLGLAEESHFFHVHKSYLVNTEQMKTYCKKTCKLTMNDGTSIPVAIRKQKDFTNTFF